MGKKERKIRDLKRTEKDFPVYRKIIDEEGLAPYVLCDSTGAYWNGFTAIDRTGKLWPGISDACRKLMINMILDGYFGEDVQEALLDTSRYEKIMDDLIT